jgi:hypothetical protein
MYFTMLGGHLHLISSYSLLLDSAFQSSAMRVTRLHSAAWADFKAGLQLKLPLKLLQLSDVLSLDFYVVSL